ncbi:MAG: hypothetical protein WDW36_007866 [Sanguina aurantia]
MDPQGLCILSRCLAQLGYQSDPGLLDAILAQTDVALLDFSPRAYAEVLWGLVRLQYRPPDAWVRRYLRAAAARAHLLQPQDTSMLLYSAAKLSQTVTLQSQVQHSRDAGAVSYWSSPSRGADSSSSEHRQEAFDDGGGGGGSVTSPPLFPPAMSLRSSLAEVLPPLLTAFEARVHTYDLQSLCCSLWALAVLRYVPSPDAVDRALQRAGRLMHSCHTTSLAMLAHALSVIVHQPSPEFCVSAFAASGPLLHLASSQDLALIAMGAANWAAASPGAGSDGGDADGQQRSSPRGQHARWQCSPPREWLDALCASSLTHLRGFRHPGGDSREGASAESRSTCSGSSMDATDVPHLDDPRDIHTVSGAMSGADGPHSKPSSGSGSNGGNGVEHDSGGMWTDGGSSSSSRLGFTAQGLSLLLAAFARLHHRPPAAWMARMELTLRKMLLSGTVAATLRCSVHPRALPLIIIALGRMGYQPHPKLAAALLDALVLVADHVPAKRLAPTLYALALLRIRPSPPQLQSLAGTMQGKLGFCYADQLLQLLEAWAVWGRMSIGSQWAGNYLAALAPKLSSASRATVVRFWVLLSWLGFPRSVAAMRELMAASCGHGPGMGPGELADSCAAAVGMLCGTAVLPQPVKPFMAAWAQAMGERCSALEGQQAQGLLSREERAALLRAQRTLGLPHSGTLVLLPPPVCAVADQAPA